MERTRITREITPFTRKRTHLTRYDTDTFNENEDGTFTGLNLKKTAFTPFRIEDTQPVHLFSLNSSHSVGVLNEKGCKIEKPELIRSDIQEYRWILKNRFQAATQRYVGLEEYMEVPDMDLWIKLKEEIINKAMLQPSKCAKIYPSDSTDINLWYDLNSENDIIHASLFLEEEENENDYNNYSMDSIDKEEARRETFIDKQLCRRRCHYDSD